MELAVGDGLLTSTRSRSRSLKPDSSGEGRDVDNGKATADAGDGDLATRKANRRARRFTKVKGKRVGGPGPAPDGGPTDTSAVGPAGDKAAPKDLKAPWKKPWN